MAASQTITTAGLGFVADVIDNSVPAPTWYFGCGTGATAAAVTDTALVAESACARVAVTPTQSSATVLDFLQAWLNTTGASIDVLEIGLFSAPAGGTLIGRAVMAAVVATPAGMPFAAHFSVPLTAA
jgi:hypothetical protein